MGNIMKKTFLAVLSFLLITCQILLLVACNSSDKTDTTSGGLLTSEIVTTSDPGLEALEPSDFTAPAWDEMDYSSMKSVSGKWTVSGLLRSLSILIFLKKPWRPKGKQHQQRAHAL